jgi:hypothetical protein
MKTINSFISEKLKITKNMINNQHNGYEFVDLDLPSGTLWAKCNIGAEKETNYGVCFAWGETKSKKEFNWDTYFDLTVDDTFEKYNNDGGLTELELKDDAAHVNMGSAWCIPTKEQFEELFKLDKKFIKNYNDTNVPGMLFTGENGNTLFLPAGNLHGRQINGTYDSENGIYWANVIGFYRNKYHTESAETCCFDTWDQARINRYYRNVGASVRAVIK